jgi:hypothetical protein
MTELAQRATARGGQHSFDREWWRAEARRCGFDWEGLIALHLDALQRLQLIEADVCDCVRPKPTQQTKPKPKPRPTPQTTIEAILCCLRERGPNALHEPENIERFRQCDTAAIAQINTRMAKLKENNP